MTRVHSLREAAQKEQTFLQLNGLLRLSEAENAALKEQVAQLQADLDKWITDYQEQKMRNDRLEWERKNIDAMQAKLSDSESRYRNELTALQSKSAALVDALEQYATDDSLPYQNTARAVLTAFKEQS
jgi:chromosome segregation ATPase